MKNLTTISMIRTIENDELLRLLSQRDAIFQGIELEEHFDDERLKKWREFRVNYEKLTPMQKDIWYLHSIIGTSKTATLMQVSKRFIQLKMREVKKCLEN